MKYFTVFSLRIANQLVDEGFAVKETGINIKRPQYRVFKFEDTEALREAVRRLSK